MCLICLFSGFLVEFVVHKCGWVLPFLSLLTFSCLSFGGGDGGGVGVAFGWRC